MLILTYVAVVAAALLWTLAIVAWYRGDNQMEPLNVALGALVSTLIGVAGCDHSFIESKTCVTMRYKLTGGRM